MKAGLTTDRKSDERSRLSPKSTPRDKPPKRKSLEQEHEERTAAALTLVYRSVLPRLAAGDRSSFRAPNGYSSPSYNRGVVHNHALFVELAAELGTNWFELVDNVERTDPSVRRIIREYMEEAALDLALYISKLPKPIREVLELRSIGMSWRSVMERLPHRVAYSVTDDYKAGLKRVWSDREDLVRRLI